MLKSDMVSDFSWLREMIFTHRSNKYDSWSIAGTLLFAHAGVSTTGRAMRPGVNKGRIR